VKKYLLALDQGTTSSRAILFDGDQNIVGAEQKEFTQYYPKEGWVEHNPMEIYSSQYAVMMELVTRYSIDPREIAALGITNQRETTILWDKTTGKPIYNAIVWQCRRTADIVDGLVRDGLEDHIKKTTGLIPDAYFSGTKIKWILDNVEGARERAKNGEILFGTVDTWLIWKLTNGAIHATDHTNASRTMIYDIHKLDWDEKLLNVLDIPKQMLPKVLPSSNVFGTVNIQGTEIPVAGAAGDQQAALFGQCCFEKGEAKNTYGTGCFLLMNTGNDPYESTNGLLTTIAASLDSNVQYALEGSVFIGGAVIQWLRDELGFISESQDSEYFAGKVPDTGGIYLVPAFTGLGAPYWDMYARGCIVGITRGTKREHIIRAAEESIA
jgi:glycerol kinase